MLCVLVSAAAPAAAADGGEGTRAPRATGPIEADSVPAIPGLVYAPAPEKIPGLPPEALIPSPAAPVFMPDTLAAPADSVAPKKRKGLIGRIIQYFDESNKPKKEKPFDISFIGGPFYSSDTKFGIGLVAAGLYRHDRTDTVLPPSDVSLYLKATTSMFFELGIEGNHIFPRDRFRLHYDLSVGSVASRFWGIGYANGANDDNESKYKYMNSQAKVDFVVRLAPNLYIGPQLGLDYIHGRDFARPELLDGQSKITFNAGFGLTAQYDTRDFLTNAYRGICVRFDQMYYPRFLSNKYSFGLSELTFNAYHGVWRGGVLALRLHGRLTYGSTPWGLMSTLGGSSNMRGYFEGRYRDKQEFDVCLELRQHVWRRNGLVAWVGAGAVFPKFSDLAFRQILPNYGIGYRWEFKKRVNVRLDLGFGRHQMGIIFNINEAF